MPHARTDARTGRVLVSRYHALSETSHGTYRLTGLLILAPRKGRIQANNQGDQPGMI